MSQVEREQNFKVIEKGLNRSSLLVIPSNEGVDPFKVINITNHPRFRPQLVVEPKVKERRPPRLTGELDEIALVEHLTIKKDIVGEKLTESQASLARREQILNDAQTLLVETLHSVSSLKVNGVDIFSRLRTHKNGQVLSAEVMAEKRAKRLKKEWKAIADGQSDLYVDDLEKRTLLLAALGSINSNSVATYKERRQVKNLKHQQEKTQGQINFLQNKDQRAQTEQRLRQLYLMLGSVQTQEQRIKVLGEVAEIKSQLPAWLVNKAEENSWTPKDWATKSLLKATIGTSIALQAIAKRSEKELKQEVLPVEAEKRPLVGRVRGLLSSLKCNPFEKGIAPVISVKRLTEVATVTLGAAQILLSMAGSYAPVVASEKPVQATFETIQVAPVFLQPTRIESRKAEVSPVFLWEARAIQDQVREEIASRDSEGKRQKPALPTETLIAGRYTESFPLARSEEGQIKETPGVEAPEQRDRRLTEEKAQKAAKEEEERKAKEATKKPDPVIPPIGDRAPCTNGEYIAKYFRPDQWESICRIQALESGGRRDAVGDRYTINGVYAPSCGPMQIRTLPGRPSCEELKTNMNLHFKKAREILDQQGWRAWRRAAIKLGLL